MLKVVEIDDIATPSQNFTLYPFIYTLKPRDQRIVSANKAIKFFFNDLVSLIETIFILIF